MKILVTTLGRIDEQITLNSFGPLCEERGVSLVVQDHEYSSHKAKFGQLQVINLPTSIKTLGPTRRYLLGRFNREKVILLDDDLLFYYRPDPFDWHLKYTPHEHLRKMLSEVEEALDKYAHVSVSAREGNNTVAEYGRENGRYMRFLAYNTAMFPDGLDIGRVDGMSDFDLNLQLLRKGIPSYTFYRYAQGHTGTQAPGGCALNRTHQTHEQEIKKMIEWHGPFVKPRLKKNKTGGEFGTRTELTIYWKKAFESSQRKTPSG